MSCKRSSFNCIPARARAHTHTHTHNRQAFDYLDELQKEFVQLHGQQIDNVERPYKFITFDTFIQKTKKLYTVTIEKNKHTGSMEKKIHCKYTGKKKTNKLYTVSMCTSRTRI
jgi:hypothetical protein